MIPWLGNGKWGKRVKITLDHNKIDADLEWFPVQIHLDSACGINGTDMTCVFDEVGANCKKIAVTMADGLTQLYVEISGWEYDRKKAWLWVSREGWVISATIDTDLFLYYDNRRPDNIDFVGETWDDVVHNVWDDNFVFVSHLRDAGPPPIDTSRILDSTRHHNDGIKAGPGEPREVQKE